MALATCRRLQNSARGGTRARRHAAELGGLPPASLSRSFPASFPGQQTLTPTQLEKPDLDLVKEDIIDTVRAVSRGRELSLCAKEAAPAFLGCARRFGRRQKKQRRCACPPHPTGTHVSLGPPCAPAPGPRTQNADRGQDQLDQNHDQGGGARRQGQVAQGGRHGQDHRKGEGGREGGDARHRERERVPWPSCGAHNSPRMLPPSHTQAPSLSAFPARRQIKAVNLTKIKALKVCVRAGRATTRRTRKRWWLGVHACETVLPFIHSLSSPHYLQQQQTRLDDGRSTT